MSEDTIIAGRQAQIELEQTEAAFKAIREGLISRLLKTGTATGESQTRDALVLTIQSLDIVRDHLLQAVQAGKDEQAIAAHVEKLAAALS